MSTRSNICIKRKDGSFEKIYCHSDGYLEYNGQILYNYYKDEDKINNLMNLGDLSVLGYMVKPDPTIPHSFDYDNRQEGVTVAYGRDRDESGTEKKTYKNEKEFLDSFHDTWCEYAYLYDENNKEWLYLSIPSKNEELSFTSLKDKLNDMGLINPVDGKKDALIRETIKFLYDYDTYEFKDTYESFEDVYFETEELFSTEQGLTNYIGSNKELLNGIEDDMDFDDELKKLYDQGMKLNEHIREYRKEVFRTKEDNLEV